MTQDFRKFIILDIMRVLKANHDTYWQLNVLDDYSLLQLYVLLVPEEEQSVSLQGLKDKLNNER